MRLRTDCVPGRKGCVLPRDTGYLVPPEERVRLLEESKRQARKFSKPSDKGSQSP